MRGTVLFFQISIGQDALLNKIDFGMWRLFLSTMSFLLTLASLWAVRKITRGHLDPAFENLLLVAGCKKSNAGKWVGGKIRSGQGEVG